MRWLAISIISTLAVIALTPAIKLAAHKLWRLVKTGDEAVEELSKKEDEVDK